MSRLYLLGIGGSAMGALAGALVEAGHEVCGSDSGVYSPMKEYLYDKGIAYFDAFDAENVDRFRPDIVVVGNAISRGNVELERVLCERYTVRSMAEILSSFFIAKHTSIVVSGTHGKTSTSSLATWVLHSASLPTGFFIGAVTGNFGCGARPVPHDTARGYFVTEGDEYDTAYFDKRSKFLSYRPDIAVINNIEFDHADIFSSIDDIIASFRLFARLVPMNGVIIANGDDDNVARACRDTPAPIETFGFGTHNFWRAVDVDYATDATHFTVLRDGLILSRFTMSMPGEHYVRNALAVIAVALRVGLSAEQIQHGFDTFAAPKRRLERIAEFRSAIVIDDFGHHPTAIRLTLGAVRQKYPRHRIIACFEPRSNTTTRNIFRSELVSAFDEADEVILGCLNRPERYREDQRLDRDGVATDIRARGTSVFVVPQQNGNGWGQDIIKHLEGRDLSNSIILLLSNGDIGGFRSLVQDAEGRRV